MLVVFLVVCFSVIFHFISAANQAHGCGVLSAPHSSCPTTAPPAVNRTKADRVVVFDAGRSYAAERVGGCLATSRRAISMNTCAWPLSHLTQSNASRHNRHASTNHSKPWMLHADCPVSHPHTPSPQHAMIGGTERLKAAQCRRHEMTGQCWRSRHDDGIVGVTF